MTDILKHYRRLPNLPFGRKLDYVFWRLLGRRLERGGVIGGNGRLCAPRVAKPRCRLPDHAFKRLVSVGGMGWSGSGAIIDLLSEYSNVTTTMAGCPVDPGAYIEGAGSEFDLARGAGGLFHLEKVLETGNQLERDAAVHLFCELVEFTYLSNRSFYGEEFIEQTRAFLDKIIAFKVSSSSGFDYCHHLASLGNEAVDHVIGQRGAKPSHFVFYLKNLDKPHFRRLANEYIHNVLGMVDSRELLVLDQALSDASGDMAKYQDYFGPIKVVYVWRDPRELYAATFKRINHEDFVPRDVGDFIRWYRNNIEIGLGVHHPDYLAVRLEDLLYDYAHTVETIEAFLNLEGKQHVRKMQSMSPEDSIRRSMGHADAHPDREAISKIKKELGEYCYEMRK